MSRVSPELEATAPQPYWERDRPWTEAEVAARAGRRQHLIEGFIDEAPGGFEIRVIRRRSARPPREFRATRSTSDTLVATLANGRRLILHRPAIFNWGVDFTVCLHSDSSGDAHDRPSQRQVVNEIAEIVSTKSDTAERIFGAIDEIYRGAPATRVLTSVEGIRGSRWDPEELLNVIEWLFVEQDVTYWSLSGRSLLMQGIRNVYRSRFAPESVVLLPSGRWVK